MTMVKVAYFKKYIVFVSAICCVVTYAQDKSKDPIFETQRITNNLDERWDLVPGEKKKTFTIMPYKPVYLLPGRWSNRPNDQPVSDRANAVIPESIDYNQVELKFQLSFKTKVLEDFLFGKGDIWLAFTQTANWQAYNDKISRPFRELNYEPEIIFNYPLSLSINEFHFKMAGFGFNHQSNGKSLPTSRSWNRFTMHLGMEYKDWSFFLKPWIRMHESAKTDDNSNIEDYVGKGELLVVYNKGGHVFSLLTRNNLRFNKHFKGFNEFTWAYPIKDNLKAFLVINNGFGESLIDYNWSQTTIGVGVSLIEW